MLERRPFLGLEATRERAGRNVDASIEPKDPGVVFRFVLEEFLLIGIADPRLRQDDDAWLCAVLAGLP